MRLFELVGVKAFKDLNANEVAKALISDGKGRHSNGLFGVTIIPEHGDFVYKAWIDDSGYEDYVKLAKAHKDNPMFPRFLSDIKTLPVFFKQEHKQHEKIKIIKMEKLKRLEFDSPLDLAANVIHSMLSRYVGDVSNEKLKELILQKFEQNGITEEDVNIDQTIEWLNLTHKVMRSSDFYSADVGSTGNVMRRGNQLVVNDPIYNANSRRLGTIGWKN